MKIDIVTLFPEMFKGPFDESILRRAQDKSLVKIEIHNLRNWATDKRGTIDDRPYGGGTGMIMRIDVINRAIENLKLKIKNLKKTKIILTSPRGKLFNQGLAHKLSKSENIILICGHYEGVDERVSEHLVDEEVSIGDYVLTGGELPAMVIVDTLTRLIPGVLEKPEAVAQESFSNYTLDAKCSTLLEYPQYTRPEKFKDWSVPKILLSGNHKKIAEWRKKKSLALTKKRRPDLIN